MIPVRSEETTPAGPSTYKIDELRVSILFICLIAGFAIDDLYSRLIMKPLGALGALFFAGVCAACGGHDDGKEWTKEELDELEAKWGYEVGCSIDSMVTLHALACYQMADDVF